MTKKLHLLGVGKDTPYTLIVLWVVTLVLLSARPHPNGRAGVL